MRSAVHKFFFEPIPSTPFRVLRAMISIVLIAQAITLFPLLLSLHDRLNSTPLARAYFIAYLGSLAFLIASPRVRAAAAAALLLRWGLTSEGFLSAYGADQLGQTALFYLALGPAENGNSWLPPRLVLRALQMHLCVLYFSSGISKAIGIQWWNGEALWRALLLTTGAPYHIPWIARFPSLPTALGRLVLGIEIGYPIFIWSRYTRWLWIALIAIWHIWAAAFLGVFALSWFFLALTFSAFGVPKLPDWVGEATRTAKVRLAILVAAHD